jgi:hypothetical protein
MAAKVVLGCDSFCTTPNHLTTQRQEFKLSPDIKDQLAAETCTDLNIVQESAAVTFDDTTRTAVVDAISQHPVTTLTLTGLCVFLSVELFHTC